MILATKGKLPTVAPSPPKRALDKRHDAADITSQSVDLQAAKEAAVHSQEQLEDRHVGTEAAQAEAVALLHARGVEPRALRDDAAQAARPAENELAAVNAAAEARLRDELSAAFAEADRLASETSEARQDVEALRAAVREQTADDQAPLKRAMATRQEARAEGTRRTPPRLAEPRGARRCLRLNCRRCQGGGRGWRCAEAGRRGARRERARARR